MDEFKAQFLAKDYDVHLNEAPADALGEGAESRETVTREVRPAKGDANRTEG